MEGACHLDLTGPRPGHSPGPRAPGTCRQHTDSYQYQQWTTSAFAIARRSFQFEYVNPVIAGLSDPMEGRDENLAERSAML